MQIEIAVGVMGWVVDQHQMRGVAAGLERSCADRQVRKIIVAIDIAVDDGERTVAQQVQGIGDATSRFQR